jgi:hypothetical protein
MDCKEFETSADAWQYMVEKSNENDGFLYSIPYNKPHIVQIEKAPEKDLSEFSLKRFYVASDYLGEGVKGLVNPINGQKYDSKASYYKAVKDAGCHVVGNDAKTEQGQKKEYDLVSEKEIKQAIEQVKSK